MRSSADGAQPDDPSSNHYGARLTALLRRRASGLAAFILLLSVFDATQAWSEGGWPALARQPETILRVTGMIALVAAIGPQMIEASSVRGWRQVLLSIVAAFVLVGLATLGVEALNGHWMTSDYRSGDMIAAASFQARTWWLYSVAGLFYAAFCHSRDRKLATIRAARQAEIDRAETQRDIVESRLKVLQARVEPEMLFGTLAEVRALYKRDPAAAGDLLDDLIGYLRAALPQMRSGSSTVAREVTLTNAYLRVLRAGRGRRWSMSAQIDDETGAAPFPPMVLLPLTLAACENSSSAVRISSSSARGDSDEQLRSVAIEVAVTVRPSGWEEDRLTAVRGIFQQFLGADATLRAETPTGSARVVLAWKDRASTRTLAQEPDPKRSSRMPVVAVNVGGQ